MRFSGILYLVLHCRKQKKEMRLFSLANEKSCGIINLNGCWYDQHALLVVFIQFDTMYSTGLKNCCVRD
jgi:hypothetical protein